MFKVIRLFAILILAATWLVGCGSVEHRLDLKTGVTVDPSTKIQISKATNVSGQKFEVDVEKLLADALAEKFKDENLLASGTDAGQSLLISSKIVEYDEGNAFKRWLMPGWGSTILTVESDLKQGSTLVGTVHARRTVSMGGGYSIGAWKTIFGDLAEDIVTEVKTKISKKE